MELPAYRLKTICPDVPAMGVNVLLGPPAGPTSSHCPSPPLYTPQLLAPRQLHRLSLRIQLPVGGPVGGAYEVVVAPYDGMVVTVVGDVMVPGTTVDVPAMARTSVVVVVPALARTEVVEVARPTEVVGSSTMVVEVETSLVVVEVSESTVSSTATSEHREIIECSPLSKSSKSNSVGEDP